MAAYVASGLLPLEDQTFLSVQTVHKLVIDLPALPNELSVDPPVTVVWPTMGYIPDPYAKLVMPVRDRLVAVRGAIEEEYFAGSPGTDLVPYL